MKNQRLIVALFALMFVFAPPPSNTVSAEPKGPQGQKYVARLISPKAGDVLIAGELCKIAWMSVLPDLDISNCETELRLSLDGGNTFTWITGERDPLDKTFDWIVPNTPTNNAVIDVHFGCLGYYPETSSIQTQASFSIREQRN